MGRRGTPPGPPRLVRSVNCGAISCSGNVGAAVEVGEAHAGDAQVQI